MIYSIKLFFVVVVAYFIQNICADEPVLVHTKYGDVLGYQTNLSRVFYGIPFAKPPINELRWNAPIPIPKWTPKIINATIPAPACPQPPCDPKSFICPPRFSEDCLYLNIFTPLVLEPTTPLPVMIFIHGGEFEQFGASAPIYNSQRWVNMTNIIIVLIQYRLGALGFLATGSDPDDIKGNYGILDQRLAIAWIKANIDAFGGNPDEITLFGQSAGAQSVALHYVNSDMQAFFQRAIIQSSPMAIPFRTYAEYITPAVLLAEELHCIYGDIACLRAASADDIIAAQESVNTKITSFEALLLFEPWVPVIDKNIVMGQPYEVIQNLSFPMKPLIIGTVADEGLIFVFQKWNQPILPLTYLEIGLAIFQDKSLKVLERYPPEGDGDQRPVISKIATQWVFACPSRIFTRKAATYSYVFGYPLNPATKNRKDYCDGHTCHGDELPYLFESNWASFTDTGRRISESIGTYWTNFAKTGNPNEPLQVPLLWPTVNSTNEQYLFFQDPLQIQGNYLKEDCDFWDTIGY